MSELTPSLNLSSNSLVERTLRLAAQATSLPVAVLLLEKPTLHVSAIYGLSLEQLQLDLPVLEQWQSREPLFLTCSSKASRSNNSQKTAELLLNHLFLQPVVSSLVILPLQNSCGEGLGTLLLGDPVARAFSDSERRTCLDFAAQLAEILELRSTAVKSHEMEIALRDSEAEMRALFAALKDVILVLDSDGRYLKIAPTNSYLLHVPIEDKLGKTVHDIFPKSQADAFLSLIRYALATQEMLSAEYTLPIGGSEVYFSTNISPLSDNTVVWVARDVTEQQQVEEALQQSVAQIRLIMDSVPARIAYVDRDQHYRFVNRQYEDWFQIPAEEIVGKQMRELLGEPIYQGCRQEIEAALQGQQVIYEDRMLSRNGQEHYFQITFTPHFRDQEVLGFYVLVQDVTERKQAEQILRLNEERFRELIQDLQVGVLVQGPNAEILICNRSALKLLGVTESQLLGKTSFDPSWNVIREDGSPFPGEMHPVPQAIATGQSVNNVVMGVHRPSQNDRVWLLVNAEPRFDEQGRIKQVICSFSDITEYRESKVELAALVAALEDVILVIDGDGRYLKIAPTNPDLLYKPAPDLIGKTAYEVFPKEMADYLVGQVRLTLATQQPVKTEYSMQIGDREIWFAAHIFPLSNSTVIWVARNITDIKQAEILLRQNNEELEKRVRERTAELEKARAQEQELADLKSRFIATASHEFRTPLTVILTSTELLKRNDIQWTDEKRMKYLQRIQDAIRNLTLILNDIFTMSKVEAGKLEFKPARLNLEVFCRDLLDEFQLLAQPYRFSLTYSNDLTDVYLDQALLWQILTNLVSNAVKYSPEGTQVDIQVNRQGDAVVFVVRDHGMGIPEEDMPRLFQAFHRAKNVGTISGTGLGLTIVRKCVDLHSGTITVESQLGVGTTITVTLPTSP